MAPKAPGKWAWVREIVTTPSKKKSKAHKCSMKGRKFSPKKERAACDEDQPAAPPLAAAVIGKGVAGDGRPQDEAEDKHKKPPEGLRALPGHGEA